MINRHVGLLQWAQWKEYPWLGLANVTDAYVADAPYFHFTDPSHIDVWHPQKGSTDLTVESTSVQYNASGWNGSQSFISSIQLRGDALAAGIAGNDKPFSLAFEFMPTSCPASSVLFWANEGTSNTKSHAAVFSGTGGNLFFGRGDGAVSKTGATMSITLSTRNVLIATFNGTALTTRLNGVAQDNAADLDVGPINFSHWALSEAITTGVSSVAGVSARTILYGSGVVWSAKEIAIIESAMRASAGV